MEVFDINKATVQEAVDYAVMKIVEQGGQCKDPSTRACAYSDNLGKHCAVGWLLDPKDSGIMSFRGGVGTLVERYEGKVPQLIKENLGVFALLQNFHDANRKIARAEVLSSLSALGIDTSGEHFQEWVAMGWDKGLVAPFEG